MVSRKGFVYDTVSRGDPGDVSPELSSYANVVDSGLLENGVFSVSLSGLSSNTGYFFRSFGYNDEVYSYGDEKYFKTLTYQVPSVGSVVVDSTSFDGVSLTSSVVSNGGKPVTEEGFVLSTTPNPDLGDESVVSTSGFNASFSGLQPDTEYFVRGYAVNDVGVGYGDVVSFFTDKFFWEFDYSAREIRVYNEAVSKPFLSGSVASECRVTVFNDHADLFDDVSIFVGDVGDWMSVPELDSWFSLDKNRSVLRYRLVNNGSQTTVDMFDDVNRPTIVKIEYR